MSNLYQIFRLKMGTILIYTPHFLPPTRKTEMGCILIYTPYFLTPTRLSKIPPILTFIYIPVKVLTR